MSLSTHLNQLSQRFRNSRRGSKRATQPKLIVSQAALSVQKEPIQSESQGSSQLSENELDEYEENVAALKKLMDGKNPPSRKLIIQLLEQTRQHRKKWLKELVSIDNIREKFPCFKQLQWVSIQPSELDLYFKRESHPNCTQNRLAYLHWNS